MSMSFSPTPNALRVELKPSNYFYVALIGVTLAALAAIFYAQLAWPSHVLLVTFAVSYAGYCWRIQKRQRGVLQWRSAWFWSDEKGEERALQLRHTTVWPGLIAMRFYDIERRRHFALTLFADSFIAPDSARSLRVHLNHFPVFNLSENDSGERAD